MKVYNTLSGKKEKFVPQSDEVKMYVCGITPYDDAHIGHAMSYIIFDVIRRYLKFCGYGLKYVQNVTDIDDKIINRANRLGVATGELAEKYTAGFFVDMKALNIIPADYYPRATGEIPKIIQVIQGLVDKGYAYPAAGSVYFRVRQAADYGKLAKRNLESMMAGARVEAGHEKEHPMDFVLWKASKPGEPSWSSPWGEGRPGWHIECSAMSLKYLGETIDIHGGGQDLIFPHHENEIAQSESFTDKKPFVKYWLHNGLLQFGEEKMSKSLGNLITIKGALEKYSIDAIRIFVLSSHYRSPLTYSEEALEAAEGGAERLLRVISREDAAIDADNTLDAESYRKQFMEAMDDDFNTPQALATIFDLVSEINRRENNNINASVHRETFLKLSRDVLGLRLEPINESIEKRLHKDVLKQYKNNNYEEAIKKIKIYLHDLKRNEQVILNMQKFLSDKFAHDKSVNLADIVTNTQIYQNSLETLYEKLGCEDTQDETSIMPILLKLDSSMAINTSAYSDIREHLRKVKNWQRADEIRSQLASMGVVLEDTPEGTKIAWKRKK